MRKIFNIFFMAGFTLSYLFIIFLGLYKEWLYVKENFINMVNPFIYLLVLWDLIRTPVVWIVIIFGAMCYLSSIGLDKITNKEFE